MPVAARAPAVGALLRHHRASRRLSQLELALEANVSVRHLSYVETGKAQPSREMIVRLSTTLALPLRERNALLIAGGFAPLYPQSPLGTPQLGQVRRAIDLILQHQEPFPAFVMNRRWDILFANQAAARVATYLRGGSAHTNMVRQFFDPNDMRAAVVNWEEVAGDLLRHLHESVTAAPSDFEARALLDEALAYPNPPVRPIELTAAPPPLLTVVFRKDAQELHFFSTIASFGTPRDVTLEDLRIECAFPADEATARICRRLAEEEAPLSATSR